MSEVLSKHKINYELWRSIARRYLIVFKYFYDNREADKRVPTPESFLDINKKLKDLKEEPMDPAEYVAYTIILEDDGILTKTLGIAPEFQVKALQGRFADEKVLLEESSVYKSVFLKYSRNAWRESLSHQTFDKLLKEGIVH